MLANRILILFYQACRNARVPVEMHIYEQGRHGLGLAANTPGTSDWPKRCEAWLAARYLMKKP
jgi:hypothetical protein